MNKWKAPNRWEISSFDDNPKYTMTIRANVDIDVALESGVNVWGNPNKWIKTETVTLQMKSTPLNRGYMPNSISVEQNPKLTINQALN